MYLKIKNGHGEPEINLYDKKDVNKDKLKKAQI